MRYTSEDGCGLAGRKGEAERRDESGSGAGEGDNEGLRAGEGERIVDGRDVPTSCTEGGRDFDISGVEIGRIEASDEGRRESEGDAAHRSALVAGARVANAGEHGRSIRVPIMSSGKQEQHKRRPTRTPLLDGRCPYGDWPRLRNAGQETSAEMEL